jgi:hypothetical protein
MLWEGRRSTIGRLHRSWRHTWQLLTWDRWRRKARILRMLLWRWGEGVLRQLLRRRDDWRRLYWSRNLSLLRLLQDLLEDLFIDETHKKECLEDGVGKLWLLSEEFGGSCRFRYGERFHLS